MKKIFLILYAVLLTYCANCQNYIDSLSFLQNENKIIIDYELTAIEKDSFYDVIVKISNATGVLEEAHSFSGDFGRVNKGGKKQLVWDVLKDIEKLNGQIQVELKATLFSNSLIDLDGDGIFGSEDQCPDIFGIKAYHGCPPPLPDSFKIEYKENLIELGVAMKCDEGKISNSSLIQIGNLIKHLNEKKSLKSIEIIGNSSDFIWKICTPATKNYINQMTMRRAENVAKELKDFKEKITLKTGDLSGLEAVKVIFYLENKITDSRDIEMIFVEGGTFIMGCTNEQGSDCEENEKPNHLVTLGNYYIGKYEITQKQWNAVMRTNPSLNIGCDECPVENVSWNDAQIFIKNLNEQTRNAYRLPTEAEWEYAARGGKFSKGYKFAGNNNIDSVAWYNQSSNSITQIDGAFAFNFELKTHPVGKKIPNELEIHDLSGNVSEWCFDWDGKYGNDQQKDPKGPNNGLERIMRGGGFLDNSNDCRVSNRLQVSPSNKFFSSGLRLVRLP
jgi:formylglycine-generating enzyme required for sulfatase activity